MTVPSVPAAAPPLVEVASWGRRFGAIIIDNILLGIPTGVFAFFMAMSEFEEAGMFDGSEPSEAEMTEIMNGMMGDFVLFGLISTIIGALYFILMHGSLGRTLGKMVFGIKVIKDDGSRCDMGAAFRRAVVYPIGGGVPYVGWLVTILNGLWPLWDDKHQSLGDKLGATYVVRKDPSPGPMVPIAGSPPQSPTPSV
ncbi:MAG TPA: RDD family protein [Actinomycetota bacterium]|nr:RDD family protein [Actinomycetota bacterium]